MKLLYTTRTAELSISFRHLIVLVKVKLPLQVFLLEVSVKPELHAQ